MRVLAIDTALEACSAAVFDTDRGGITASESLAMARGHAEAVMPLLARVMDLAEIEFASLDRNAASRHPEPPAPLPPRHRRSQADGMTQAPHSKAK